MAAGYLQYCLECVVLVYQYVVEKVWTPVPSDEREDGNLLLGGAAYPRTSPTLVSDMEASSEDTNSDAIVIIHHGSIDHFCGTSEAPSIPKEGNDELLEYIDGYVGWLTSPREEKHERRASHMRGNNAKEFIEWLSNNEPETEDRKKEDFVSGNDNQEEPQSDDGTYHGKHLIDETISSHSIDIC